jgi:hypothetical protein
MKVMQYSIRILVLVGSFAGFFGGWALFAHAGKPAPAVAAPASVAPADLPPLDFSGPTDLQPLQPIQPLQPRSTFVTPRLRTRGS